MRKEQVSVRLPSVAVDEAEELVPKMREHPAFEMGTPTLRGVLRLAMLRGLAVLRREAR